MDDLAARSTVPMRRSFGASSFGGNYGGVPPSPLEATMKRAADSYYLNSIFGPENLERLQTRNSFSQLYPEDLASYKRSIGGMAEFGPSPTFKRDPFSQIYPEGIAAYKRGDSFSQLYPEEVAAYKRALEKRAYPEFGARAVGKME